MPASLILPVNFVQPPGQKVHAGVGAFVVVVRAVPVKPPAATYRAEANRIRIPAFQRSRFREIGVAHFVVGRRIGMDIAMRAAPDVDLVVHVVEVRRAAKCRSQRRRPLVAIDRSRRISVLRRVAQLDIGVGRIVPGYDGLAIRHHSISGVGVVRIRPALRTVLRDRKTPARRLRHPGQHDHRHQRIASRCFHILNVLRRIGVADLRVAKILEIPIGGGVVGEGLPVVARGRVAAPAHHGEAAVGNRRRILGIASAVNVGADRMPIAENVYGDVDRGCRWIGGGRARGRRALCL